MESGTVRSKAIGHDGLWPIIPLQISLHEIRRRLAPPRVARKASRHVTFMIYSAPATVVDRFDLGVNLVELPTPMAAGLDAIDLSEPGLSCKQGHLLTGIAASHG